jgi:hypothetical protein
MVLLSHWITTDPHDRLYAILGLAEETRDLEKCPELAPNYEKSLLDVYKDIARYLLEKERGHDTANRRISAPGIRVLASVQHRIGIYLSIVGLWYIYFPFDISSLRLISGGTFKSYPTTSQSTLLD